MIKKGWGRVIGINTECAMQNHPNQSAYASGKRGMAPYWYKDRPATNVFSEIWKYLRVMRDIADYEIYDPQLDRIIDLEEDLDNAIRCDG